MASISPTLRRAACAGDSASSSAGTPESRAPRRRGVGQPVAAVCHLGAHHFAFYRGVLEGLDLAKLGARYLETGRDRRQARLTQMRIEAELLRGVRRLPRIESSFIEEARVSKPLPDAATWEALFRVTGTGVTARVRVRQLAALDAVRPLLTRIATTDDLVAGWLAPAVSARLTAAGLMTLSDLQACVVTYGVHWYRRVPRIGAMTARRIVDWLRTDSGAFGVLGAFPPAVLVPRRALTAMTRASLRPAAVMIAPLEALILPIDRDGRHGHNRAAPVADARIAAHQDLAAIQAWLATRGPEQGATWRTYRSHAERLLLWSIFVRGKAMSDLTVEDCTGYLAFLADPQPAVQWIGQRGVPRYSYAWRPFAGPLAPASVRQSFTVVSGLFMWLVNAHYLRYNPWALVAKPKAPRSRMQVSRSFTKTQWALLQRCAEELPLHDPRSARLVFLLRFAYATGLRIAELARATIGDLHHRDLPDDPRGTWELVFIGKGALEREVHVSHAVIGALRRYLIARGLPADFGRLHPATPLIGRVKADAKAGRLSVEQIHAIFKRFFVQVAARLADEDGIESARIASASAHWLRHSFGHHAIAYGVALDVVQSQLGHASLATTSIYVRAETDRRAQELERPGIF